MSQARRAGVSVPSNIAEGQDRKFTIAYTNHPSIAFGSLMDLEAEVQIAMRLDSFFNVEAARLLDRTNRVGKMLSAPRPSPMKRAGSASQ
jgi:four helix bundle protein